MGLKDIGIGWGRWLRMLDVSKKVRDESERRLLVCEACEHATPSKLLELIGGKAQNVYTMYCSECFCPCHQKSLTDDLCPLGKWAPEIK